MILDPWKALSCRKIRDESLTIKNARSEINSERYLT